MQFEHVINGILKYMDREIYPGMNDLQEIGARIAVSRLVNNSEKLKEFLKNNVFVRTFAIIDETGEVDIDNLFGDIIEQVDKKGKIEISIPMFGKFKFTTKDFENLYQTIKGE
jgi:hypothetical protein